MRLHHDGTPLLTTGFPSVRGWATLTRAEKSQPSSDGAAATERPPTLPRRNGMEVCNRCETSPLSEVLQILRGYHSPHSHKKNKENHQPNTGHNEDGKANLATPLARGGSGGLEDWSGLGGT